MALVQDLVGAGLGAALWFALGRLPLDAPTRRWLRVGFVLITLGCLARLWIAAQVYGGNGDYMTYVRQGEVYAAAVWRDGPGALLAPELWSPGRWWGAGVVSRLAGLAVVAVGPSIVSTSLVFAWLGLGGLALFVLAFQRALPGARTATYAAWLVLAPSVVYWSALVGKEAPMLLGLGAAAWGLAGAARPPGDRRRRALRLAGHGLVGAAGAALVFAIRPPVAVVLAAAVAAAACVRLALAWSPRRALAAAAALGVGAGVAALAGAAIAAADLVWTGPAFSFFDPSDVARFLEQKAAASQQGDSAIARPWGELFLIEGIVEVLFRPFPWGATSPVRAAAAAEVLAFWGLVLWHRRAIGAFLRAHGRTGAVAFALAFAALYGVALGLALDNEGTMVRQRALMLPFVFVLVAGRLAPPETAPDVHRPTGVFNAES